jgi:AraC-like DNA-binding protein/ligand-binding sensor protein
MNKRFDPEINTIIQSLNDIPILGEIREIYYMNTGMTISFHYPGKKSAFDFYPPFERSDFCTIIHSTEKGMEKCLESDYRGLLQAKNKGEYCIYQCHAGLTDVVIPLEYHGVEMGSIYSGQILTRTPTESDFERIYKKVRPLGISSEALKESYFRVKVIDKERLLFCVKLLALIANYIIAAENELYLQKEIIRKNKELTRKESEKNKLEKSLKDLSISVLEFEKKTKDTPLKFTNENLKNNHVVSKAQLFIKTQYNKDINLGDVADAVYLSPNYFSFLFKKITGFNFSAYLTKIRIEAAKDLLSHTITPIKKIVHQVGFEDYNYFNRTFKRLENIPPARYRSNHRAPETARFK